MDFKIIDSHTHTYPEKIASRAASNLGVFYDFTVEKDGTFDCLLRSEREAGISGFITLPVATSVTHVDSINALNSENMKKGREQGFEAYSFGCMHQDYEDFKSGVSKIKELGLLGIKIQPDLQGCDIDDIRFMRLYEEMEKVDLRLYLHVGDYREKYRFSMPERVIKVANTFPNLKICAAHFGAYTVWEDKKDVIMGGYDNIWYDCSASIHLMNKEDALDCFARCGYKKVMFGSDYPAVSPKKGLDDLRSLDFDDVKMRDILYNNVRRYLGVI